MPKGTYSRMLFTILPAGFVQLTYNFLEEDKINHTAIYIKKWFCYFAADYQAFLQARTLKGRSWIAADTQTKAAELRHYILRKFLHNSWYPHLFSFKNYMNGIKKFLPCIVPFINSLTCFFKPLFYDKKIHSISACFSVIDLCFRFLCANKKNTYTNRIQQMAKPWRHWAFSQRQVGSMAIDGAGR